MDDEKIIEDRKKKIKEFLFRNPSVIFYAVLILLVILGAYIRYLPLTDHNGNPGLWDITTQDYTLGPDLDPFLFLRYARTMIENGSLPRIDNMRYVPHGFDTTTELQMVSYMIVLTYKLTSMFGQNSINYAGAFMPVLFFGLTIISFFFFVREIFIRKNDKKTEIKAGLIASISTLFMIIIPAFLSRTVAGIPEKESVAFFFMFLAFFLFLRSWKSEKLIKSSIWAILTGIATGLMGLTWGGVTYLYVTIGLAGLIGFVLGKFDKNKTIAYALWLVSSLGVMLTFTNRFSLKNFILGFDTGLACLVLGLLIAHYILSMEKIRKIFGLGKIKLPTPILTLIITLILGILIILIVSPSAITEKINALENILIKPVTGRWNTTVAENKQPYFTEWYGSFGKWIFWLFFIGSLLLFKKMFKNLGKKDSWVLTGLYIFFFLGLVFSRYAAHPALLDGENFISKLFYFGSAVLLVGYMVYLYILYHKNKNEGFEKTEFEYIFLFSLFVLTLFTARSAVRLIMVLVPIAPIFLSYLLVESGFEMKEKKGNYRMLIGIVFVVTLLFSCMQAYGYYKEIKTQAYNYVPYYYTLQWQEAMSWIRNNTPSNSVFNHWWDYGYWVQSIGERATVTDGGNANVWWNYLTGRLVLTGDNQKDALEFLWNHNVSYFLIDSSDMGKYGAFSQIGSDKEYDRFSTGPLTALANTELEQETSKGRIRIYQTNGVVDEDITYMQNGTKIFIPGPTRNFQEEPTYYAGIGGFIIETIEEKNSTLFEQPIAVFIYNNQQIRLPLRYLYVGDKLYDFKTGIEAGIRLIQKVEENNGRLGINPLGAAIYLSPRVLKGFLGQVYIFEDPLNNFENFELVHSQPDYIIEQLNKQGANLEDFVYYSGLRGPIKIWKVKYKGNEKRMEDYLLTSPPDYITWKF